jgi:hypothetical protein
MSNSAFAFKAILLAAVALADRMPFAPWQQGATDCRPVTLKLDRLLSLDLSRFWPTS